MVNDHVLIERIAERAATMYQHFTGDEIKPSFIASEIRIAHFEVMRLRLQELLDADEGDFAHDIFGIHKHLDIGRECKFTQCFVPRYAA